MANEDPNSEKVSEYKHIDAEISEEKGDRINPRPIEVEMKHSYIDYSMSVIVGRALPDARDGLKPVHRRILYSMNEMGVAYNKAYKKSARIVGDVLGKYHPHGDSAVYDALVRMAQPFSLRYTLIDGQGNFGSMDGDSAAAMRYTESRMARIASEMLKDIDKNTVEFMPNFDESLQEPVVLPSAIPNLLINGSSGIAVGMATNMPPHNLGEVVDATISLIDNPDMESKELMQFLKGPDFPTGGIIYGKSGIYSSYTTGRGTIKIRSKYKIEKNPRDKNRMRIIVTEIPYQVNKSRLLEKIAQLVKDKVIGGISDIRDESDRHGVRVVIELKKGIIPDVVLNNLYKHTQMENTFGIINLAIVDGRPKVMSLKQIIDVFINHRVDVITRKTKYELDESIKRAHILEGLVTALDNIDEVIKIIRGASSPTEASESLMSRFEIDKIQASSILDMRLQKLTSLETEKLLKEKENVDIEISRLEKILSSRQNILEIIKDELIEIKKRYGDERKTEIKENTEELEMEDLIPKKEVVVTISNKGYIKRTSLESYRVQRRGGMGSKGAIAKDTDFIEYLFTANSHDTLLFFTNKGRLYWLKVYYLPDAGKATRGKPIINFLPRLMDGETIIHAIPVKEFDNNHYVVMATKKGIVKKTNLSSFSHQRITGVRAITVREDDELLAARISDGTSYIILATKNGQAIKFHETNIRSMGRTAMGVKGIRLDRSDEVVTMVTVPSLRTSINIMDINNGIPSAIENYSDDKSIEFPVFSITENRNLLVVTEHISEARIKMNVDSFIPDDKHSELLTITENGYGKRSNINDYRLIRRGGRGVRTIITDSRNGSVVSVRVVDDDDELVITTANGIVIRMRASEIRVQGRNTKGVRIIRLKENDTVMNIARVAPDDIKDELDMVNNSEHVPSSSESADKASGEDDDLSGNDTEDGNDSTYNDEKTDIIPEDSND